MGVSYSSIYSKGGGKMINSMITSLCVVGVSGLITWILIAIINYSTFTGEWAREFMKSDTKAILATCAVWFIFLTLLDVFILCR